MFPLDQPYHLRISNWNTPFAAGSSLVDIADAFGAGDIPDFGYLSGEPAPPNFQCIEIHNGIRHCLQAKPSVMVTSKMYWKSSPRVPEALPRALVFLDLQSLCWIKPPATSSRRVGQLDWMPMTTGSNVFLFVDDIKRVYFVSTHSAVPSGSPDPSSLQGNWLRDYSQVCDYSASVDSHAIDN